MQAVQPAGAELAIGQVLFVKISYIAVNESDSYSGFLHY